MECLLDEKGFRRLGDEWNNNGDEGGESIAS